MIYIIFDYWLAWGWLVKWTEIWEYSCFWEVLCRESNRVYGTYFSFFFFFFALGDEDIILKFAPLQPAICWCVSRLLVIDLLQPAIGNYEGLYIHIIGISWFHLIDWWQGVIVGWNGGLELFCVQFSFLLIQFLVTESWIPVRILGYRILNSCAESGGLRYRWNCQVIRRCLNRYLLLFLRVQQYKWSSCI